MNSTYHEMIANWSTVNNNKYYFAVTKCCGYTFFIPIYKSFDLHDLYKHVAAELCNNNITLHSEQSHMNTDNKITLNYPRNIEYNLSHWINANRNKLEIITKVPDPIIYRLWVDDGHSCHK